MSREGRERSHTEEEEGERGSETGRRLESLD